MKKISLILILALLISFLGCSSNEGSTTDESLDDLVLEKGILYVATSPDYPPYESYDTDGNIVGFEIDLMNAVVEYITTEDGTPYTVEYVAMDFSTIITAVQAGQADIGLSAFSYTEERAEQVAFTDLIQDTKQVVTVLADSGIESLDDLNGKSVAAGTGTSCWAAAEAIEGVTMVSPGNYQVMFELLRAGQIDAVACDYDIAQGYVEGNEEMVMLDDYLSEEQISMICSLDNEPLLEALNEAIAQIKADGTYDALLEEWGLA